MRKKIMVLIVILMSMSFTLPSFAGTGDAYFFGYSEDDVDTTDEMENVEYYLDRMGYYTKIFVNPALSRFTNSRLNSTFLYFAGHGSRNDLNTGEDRGICINGEDGYKDINSTDFSNTKLAILAACKCGYEGSHSTCIAREIQDNGATCVLAWTTSVNAPVLADYTKRYAKCLKNGDSFLDACVNTREYLLSKGLYKDSAVLNTILFGEVDEGLDWEEDLKYNINTSSNFKKNISEDDYYNKVFAPYICDEINHKIISENVRYKADSKDFSDIESYINKYVDSSFDINDYEISEFGENKNGVNSIVFRLLVNGVVSNYGFSIICINGKAGLINFTDTYAISKIECNKVASSSKIYDYSDEYLFDKAIEADGYNYDIDEQYVQKYYDVETNKIVNEVNTVYVDENGMLFCTLNVF